MIPNALNTVCIQAKIQAFYFVLKFTVILTFYGCLFHRNGNQKPSKPPIRIKQAQYAIVHRNVNKTRNDQSEQEHQGDDEKTIEL